MAPSGADNPLQVLLEGNLSYLVSSSQYWLDKIDVFELLKHFRTWKYSVIPVDFEGAKITGTYCIIKDSSIRIFPGAKML